MRCITFYDNNKVRLHSRSGKDCTRQFPDLCSLTIDAEEAILDGEITVLTDGKPDFEAVMEPRCTIRYNRRFQLAFLGLIQLFGVLRGFYYQGFGVPRVHLPFTYQL